MRKHSSPYEESSPGFLLLISAEMPLADSAKFGPAEADDSAPRLRNSFSGKYRNPELRPNITCTMNQVSVKIRLLALEMASAVGLHLSQSYIQQYRHCPGLRVPLGTHVESP
jgi:hypothetical protein